LVILVINKIVDKINGLNPAVSVCCLSNVVVEVRVVLRRSLVGGTVRELKHRCLWGADVIQKSSGSFLTHFNAIKSVIFPSLWTPEQVFSSLWQASKENIQPPVDVCGSRMSVLNPLRCNSDKREMKWVVMATTL